MVDAVGAGAGEFIFAVAAGHETDAKGSGALRGEEVPDAVADDDGVRDRDAEFFRGHQEEIGVGFGEFDLVAGDDWDVIWDAEHTERPGGAFDARASGDREGDFRFREKREQFAGAGEWADLIGEASVGFAVEADEAIGFVSCYCVTGFAEDGIRHQAAAHADATMDAPHGELDADAGHCFAPREDVLVDAVDERAIEIEEEGGTRGARFRRLRHSLLSIVRP